MEYSDLNNYLQSLKVNKEENNLNKNNKKEIDVKASKTTYATVDCLQRDLTLFNDMNNEYNVEMLIILVMIITHEIIQIKMK